MSVLRGEAARRALMQLRFNQRRAAMVKSGSRQIPDKQLDALRRKSLTR